ncbi:Protein dyf-8 [Toxocara canis]|uniref:Protein dyf-8 n=1 Tax=Toxocara canis TaxID=6265 RepID=A0A0B2V475_TOXCA|nr:Protein dyf-8 [Toxocara canis]
MIYVVWILLLILADIDADGFVEEVSCTADSITVMLNKSDPDIQKWMANPKSQPIVYVYEHKSRTPCGSALKNGNLVNYNFTIPYGRHCNVHLTDLEPNYQNAETTIALEDNADQSTAKTLRVNHVFCLYTRSVQTIRFNDISTGHEVVASTGGKPKPRVEMIFRSVDGRPLRAAKFGDTVEFYVALSPDKAYHGIIPKECMFSDREDMSSPDAKHLTFVQSSCPVDEISEIIDPLANVNEEVYFSKFKTFRFGNQSTVFAHCTVQVCLNSAECSQKCFKRISNSNLTAEKLRFRYKRDGQLENYEKADLVDEVALTRPLTILDDSETSEVSGRAIEQCLVSPASLPPSIFFLIIALATTLVVALTVICIMIKKLTSNKKVSAPDFGLYSAYSGSTTTLPSCAFSGGPYALPNTLNRPNWVNAMTSGYEYP